MGGGSRWFRSIGLIGTKLAIVVGITDLIIISGKRGPGRFCWPGWSDPRYINAALLGMKLYSQSVLGAGEVDGASSVGQCLREIGQE